MFTGIVDRVAATRAVVALEQAIRVDIATGYPDLALGESVAVNGVCLTVVETDATGRAAFFVSAETLARSNLGRLAAGHVVNLERAVTLATRLSGHLVQGHVDGLGKLVDVASIGDSRRITLSLPGDLQPFCVEKGSIGLDGVSLTLNAVTPPDAQGRFGIEINLVPHTWDHTNLRHRSVGDAINVEVDVIAKYVERQCRIYLNR